MSPALLRCIAALMPACSLTVPSAAQEGVAAAGFRVVAPESPDGWVELVPEGAGPEGTLRWSCGKGRLTLSIAGGGDAPMVSYAIWRFTGEPADTTFFVEREVRGADLARITDRAKRRDRLLLRVMGPEPTAAGVEHRYDLGGGGEAVLNRLPCARTIAGYAVRGSWPPPEGLVGNPAPEPPGVPSDTTSLKWGYELSAVEVMPSLVNPTEVTRAIAAGYPQALRDAGVTGQVLVRFMVLPDGRVAPASLRITSATHPDFEQVVLRVLPLMHFRPARVNGRPVRVWVEQPILFSLAQ